MDEKSNPFRFTLLFNRNDSRHQRAVDILNQQGKSKSQYIVTALLHYVDCTRQPIEQAVISDLQSVAEHIIRETSKSVLEGIPKQLAVEKGTMRMPASQMLSPQKETGSTAQMDAERELLQGSLGALRNRK